MIRSTYRYYFAWRSRLVDLNAKFTDFDRLDQIPLASKCFVGSDVPGIHYLHHLDNVFRVGSVYLYATAFRARLFPDGICAVQVLHNVSRWQVMI